MREHKESCQHKSSCTLKPIETHLYDFMLHFNLLASNPLAVVLVAPAMLNVIELAFRLAYALLLFCATFQAFSR